MPSKNEKVISTARVAIANASHGLEFSGAPLPLEDSLRLEFAMQGDIVDARAARKDAEARMMAAAGELLHAAAGYAIAANSDGATRAAQCAVSVFNALDAAGRELVAGRSRETLLFAVAAGEIANKSSILTTGAQAAALDIHGATPVSAQ